MSRCALLALLALLIAAPASAQDVLVANDSSPGSYTRHDGGSDATVNGCSTGRRSQNEPSVAVDPSNSDVIVAGSNDYCAEIGDGAGNQWPGYYRSTNGGATWSESLVPGYPGDPTESPTSGSCASAGDPTQAFDGDGRLYYGFICFNRVKPTNGSIYVARYDNHGSEYALTSRVDRGTPSVWGLFQDKINVTADQGESGNVYVAWARFSGAQGNDVIMFSRSTDRGQTYSKPQRISDGGASEQFADLAVGPDGAVYLTYRTYSTNKGSATIAIVKSTDHGQSFSRPRTVAAIDPFDSDDYGPDTCGDGPFRCESGLNYARFFSLSAVAADAQGVHVVWSARDADGQAKIFASNSPDGLTWGAPVPLDGVAAGHQFFPDIASDGSTLSVVFQDSRADGSYSPDLPPGNTAAGKTSGNVIDTYLARSANGLVWTETLASGARSNPNFENRGTARSPFFGDYNYVSSAPDGTTFAVWTDTRDLRSFTDPRTGNEDDGFDADIRTCVFDPPDIFAAAYTAPSIADPCFSQGGLDQNIYGIGAG